jgi:hypothetical protein
MYPPVPTAEPLPDDANYLHTSGTPTDIDMKGDQEDSQRTSPSSWAILDILLYGDTDAYMQEPPLPREPSPVSEDYPFLWMGKSQYLCHLERSNYGYMMTPVPHQQWGAIPSQQGTPGPPPLHRPIVSLPQFIGGSHQEGDTRFLFHL